MSSIDTIYEKCQRLAQMQNKGKAIVRREEEKKDKAVEPTGHQKVASLISKLEETKIKIDELTKVLD